MSAVVFAVAMHIGGFGASLYTAPVSYFACSIAVGYVVFAAAVVTHNGGQTRAAGLAGLVFAAMYAVLILIASFALLTIIHLTGGFSGETLSLTGYERLGNLFFNYNRLGYGLMGLLTIFIRDIVEKAQRRQGFLQAALVSWRSFPVLPRQHDARAFHSGYRPYW